MPSLLYSAASEVSLVTISSSVMASSASSRRFLPEPLAGCAGQEVSDGRDSSPVQSGVSSADSAAIALQTGESPDTSFGKGNAEKLPDDSFTEEDYVADKGFPPSKIKEELRERPELYPPLFGAAGYLPG